MADTSQHQPIRHILSLSGGKDSTALAIFMRDKVQEMEYVFCDTEQELPETYEYLDRIEVFLGKEIKRLKFNGKGFDDLLQARRGYLPSAHVRWCTELLKIRPFENYIGDDLCISYVGIRADEQHRKGYISTKPNISPRYPFIEANISKQDVFRILEDSGLGIPKYYAWRSRSGCYFCFFQQRIEWVGLLENHPDLYEKAKKYEKEDKSSGERFTWSPNESLTELQNPERINQIKNDDALRQESYKPQANRTLINIFNNADSENEGCLICSL
jgi:3'-phosphoadenosine 5'-phosphosulfate sulfotransferase (PAPS reductase)/FAD synthetase